MGTSINKIIFKPVVQSLFLFKTTNPFEWNFIFSLCARLAIHSIHNMFCNSLYLFPLTQSRQVQGCIWCQNAIPVLVQKEKNKTYKYCYKFCAELMPNPTKVPNHLTPFINYSKLIACSLSDYERGFSLVNLIVTLTLTRLTVSHVSSLVFVKCTVQH